MEKKHQSIYLTCQRGATPVLKADVARRYTDLKFSYSQPGFLTYLLPAYKKDDDTARNGAGDGELDAANGSEADEEEYEGQLSRRSRDGRRILSSLPDPTILHLAFARTCSFGLDKVFDEDETPDRDKMTTQFLGKTWGSLQELGGVEGIGQIHVWEPDKENCGRSGYEPGITPLADEIRTHLVRVWNSQRFGDPIPEATSEARPGSRCLDCILVRPNQWWLGIHDVTDFHTRFPGGFMPFTMPTDAASRAWLKFEEGLRWSGFPIEPESQCVDIGSAPGGCSQVLLARGARVLGVDPAEMDPAVLANPYFTHLRSRVNQLKRKTFRHSRWFFTDMNVAPNYTLDALEELVLRPDISARGLLFTLKLLKWELVKEIPDYIRRIKSWGFNRVKIRQLQYNRQEVMVAALKKPFRKSSGT